MHKILLGGIQFKFVMLMLCISAILSSVSIVNILSLQRLTDASTVITENEIPKLSAVQEILSAIISADLYSDSAFHDGRLADTAKRQEYRRLFEDSINHSHLFLEALTWGSESEAFREIEGGKLYEEWKDLGHDTNIAIDKPSQKLAALAGEVNLYLTGYETNIHKSLDAHEESDRLHAAGQIEEAMRKHEEAIAFEEKASLNFLEPINATLEQIEELSNEEVRNEVVVINAITKQVKHSMVSASIIGTIIVLIVGIVFAHFFITRPIKSLTLTAEVIAGGKLSERVTVESSDEIGRLAHAFNIMTDRLISSHSDMEKKVDAKTRALSEMLDKFETKNDDLEKAQLATVNLLEDLEEEKRAVEQKVKDRTEDIEREKNKLLQVTSNMNGGAILFDKDRAVAFTNELALSILGLKGVEATSEQITKAFFTYFGGKEIKSHFKKCLGGNTFHVPEIQGGGRLYEIFFHYLKNDHDNTEESIGYFVLFLDITDAKLLERSKSELVAVASHQLRTPLTAMRGNVEMLVDESFGPLNKEQHELLDDVEVSTIRLITMVNEMLDITKIERGDLEMTLETLKVKEIVDSVAKDLDMYAERHEFKIDVGGVDDMVAIYGDKVRVRQIFQNLVDNAIKYSSHPGKLEISTSVQDGMVEVSFKDNCIGVPKNEQSKLFGRFYRASNTAKTASSGSGLGLYIVKSIAQQLGGNIRFESAEGKGTTFIVSLPVDTGAKKV